VLQTSIIFAAADAYTDAAPISGADEYVLLCSRHENRKAQSNWRRYPVPAAGIHKARNSCSPRRRALAQLRNGSRIHNAQTTGRRSQPEQADRLAAWMRPIIAEIRAAGVRGSVSIAAVLNARGIQTARGTR
jgi:hypothetical protein